MSVRLSLAQARSRKAWQTSCPFLRQSSSCFRRGSNSRPARPAVSTNLVALFKALGGGWQPFSPYRPATGKLIHRHSVPLAHSIQRHRASGRAMYSLWIGRVRRQSYQARRSGISGRSKSIVSHRGRGCPRRSPPASGDCRRCSHVCPAPRRSCHRLCPRPSPAARYPHRSAPPGFVRTMLMKITPWAGSSPSAARQATDRPRTRMRILWPYVVCSTCALHQWRMMTLLSHMVDWSSCDVGTSPVGFIARSRPSRSCRTVRPRRSARTAALVPPASRSLL